jgi:hypothetical protein
MTFYFIKGKGVRSYGKCDVVGIENLFSLSFGENDVEGHESEI